MPDFSLFNAIGTAVLVHDAETMRLLWVNDSSCNLFGYEREVLLSLPTTALIANEVPYSESEMIASFSTCRLVGHYETEFQLRTVDGSLFWGRLVMQAQTVEARALIIVTVLDISREHDARVHELAREEDFRLLFDEMNEGVALHGVIYNPQGQAVDYRILDVNQHFSDQTGIDGATVRGQLATKVYGVNPPPYLKEYAAVAESGEPCQLETYFPPLDRHFLISVASMRRGFFVTIFFDITERKRFERELAESQVFIASIAGAIPDFLYVVELPSLQILYTNRSLHAQLGFPGLTTGRATDGSSILDLYPEEDRHELLAKHWPLIEKLSDGAVYSWEHKVHDGSGVLRWINERVTVFQRGLEGEVTRIIGVAENITVRKQLQSELDILFDNSLDIICIANINGYFSKINPVATRILGWSATELMACPYFDFIHPEDQARTREMADGPADPWGLFAFENRYRCKDGSYCWLSWNAFFDGENFYAIARDVSDRVKITAQLQELNASLERRVQERNEALDQSQQLVQQSQEQLIASEKLVQLGELVAGLTHEVNTPLGLATTTASFMRSRAQGLLAALQGAIANPKQGFSAKTLQKELEAINEACDLTLENISRAGELISAFKLQSVDRATNLHRRFCLVEMINQTLFSLKPRLRHTPWKVLVECNPGLEIDSYPGDLSQILINFVINSLVHGFDGLDSGTIHIEASLDPDNPQMVQIKYSDDGVGIPQELQSRVFEPFFTTKREQGGSGLGLSIVESLVKHKLGGTLKLESRTARNGERGYTSFSICLPHGLS